MYVSKYAVTTQLLCPNPFRSSVIATKEVLTIDISKLARKRPRHRLHRNEHLHYWETASKRGTNASVSKWSLHPER